jgi:CelD/BcsL family acetyltransferase involved in cellulose biosynthesis
MATTLSTNPSGTSAPSAARLRFVRARSLEEVDALEWPWRELGSRVDAPLSQFLWQHACYAAFPEDGTPHVIACLRNQELLAVAPLVKKRHHGIRRLFLAGVGELHEPADLIWSDERALTRLVAVIARGGTPLQLERIPKDSLSLQKLKRTYRGRALVVTRPQANCPYITLDESWLEPEQHLNSGRRSDLRRARRKAEQQGQVTTEIHTPDLDDLPELLDRAFEVEANSWKGDAGTALAHDAHRAVFYRQYAEVACVEGILRICFLRIGDRVAAMQLAIEQGGGFWLLKVGYDARFANCSPGLLLMRDTIRYAVEAGLNSYEFLGKAESWTEVWTKTEREYVSVRVYPLGVRGALALAADAATNAYQRWSKK